VPFPTKCVCNKEFPGFYDFERHKEKCEDYKEKKISNDSSYLMLLGQKEQFSGLVRQK
jgi:hypothetical protein